MKRFRYSFPVFLRSLLLSGMILSGTCFDLPRCNGGEVRRLTDDKGRKITAEIMGVKGSQVSLTVGDSKFDFPIAKLSKEDQQYIREWAQNQKKNLSNAVAMECTKKRAAREKINGAAKDVIREDWIFEFLLSNQSPEALENLEMRCRVFYWNAQIGGDKKSKQVVPSTIEISSLPGGNKKTKVATKPVSIVETNINGSYADGSSSKKKDELEGIWARLYQGDQLLAEFKTNTATMQKETWPEK